MGWFEVAKEALSIAQKADNIELVKAIMELQQQMSDMREENRELKDKIHQLQISDDIESKLIRHNSTYYTLKFDNGMTEDICACCWNELHIKIPVNNLFNGYYKCPKCKNQGVYNNEEIMNKRKQDRIKKENRQKQINDFLNFG